MLAAQRLAGLSFSWTGWISGNQPASALSERPSGHVMLGWTKWAIAIAIAGLAVGGAAPAIAGDTTVAVQRLGPPDVEARREVAAQADACPPQRSRSRLRICDPLFASRRLGGGRVDAGTHADLRAEHATPPARARHILYYKLGPHEVARSYFAQALANPSVPPAVAAQVRLYLSQLALAADPPAFSASIFSAIRWESNANAGPGTQSITLNGLSTSPSTSNRSAATAGARSTSPPCTTAGT